MRRRPPAPAPRARALRRGGGHLRPAHVGMRQPGARDGGRGGRKGPLHSSLPHVTASRPCLTSLPHVPASRPCLTSPACVASPARSRRAWPSRPTPAAVPAATACAPPPAPAPPRPHTPSPRTSTVWRRAGPGGSPDALTERRRDARARLLVSVYRKKYIFSSCISQRSSRKDIRTRGEYITKDISSRISSCQKDGVRKEVSRKVSVFSSPYSVFSSPYIFLCLTHSVACLSPVRARVAGRDAGRGACDPSP